MSQCNHNTKQFLAGVMTPERADLLGNLADLLTALGEIGHEFALEQILSLSDDTAVSETIASIETLLANTAMEHLQSHGIIMNDEDLDLGVVTGLLKMLVELPAYGDPESLLDIINEEDSGEMVVAELAIYFTEYTNYTQVLPSIAQVNYLLIESMQMALTESLNAMTVSVAGDVHEGVSFAEIRSRLKTFVNSEFPEYEQSLIYRSIQSGIFIGGSFDAYVDASFNELEEMEPEDAVVELVAMAYASNLAETDIRTHVQEHFEALYGSINNITRADVKLSHLLSSDHG